MGEKEDAIFGFLHYMKESKNRTHKKIAKKYDLQFAGDRTEEEVKCEECFKSMSDTLENIIEGASSSLLPKIEVKPGEFRQCPHKDCGQIWQKTEGCGTWTTCGAVPSSSRRKTFQKFGFKYVGK